jgi:MYXO-CTERM domain-containing protein
VPESTATDFVFVFQPEIEADTVYQIFENGSEPSMPIDGDSTYSLTFGVRIDSLGSNQNFTTASGLTYILPEPASMVTWAAVVGLAGFTAKRRRRNCDK